MPTPIAMVPLDAIADLRVLPSSWLEWAEPHAVLAIPVQSDGIFLEDVTADDVAAYWSRGTGPGYERVITALRKAAGA